MAPVQATQFSENGVMRNFDLELAANAAFRQLRIAMLELILSNHSNSVNNDC
jgi:hypothetical protein